MLFIILISCFLSVVGFYKHICIMIFVNYIYNTIVIKLYLQIYIYNNTIFIELYLIKYTYKTIFIKLYLQHYIMLYL